METCGFDLSAVCIPSKIPTWLQYPLVLPEKPAVGWVNSRIARVHPPTFITQPGVPPILAETTYAPNNGLSEPTVGEPVAADPGTTCRGSARSTLKRPPDRYRDAAHPYSPKSPSGTKSDHSGSTRSNRISQWIDEYGQSPPARQTHVSPDCPNNTARDCHVPAGHEYGAPRAAAANCPFLDLAILLPARFAPGMIPCENRALIPPHRTE